MKNTGDLPAIRQHMNLLFDFYGSMLTPKQAECFSMRYAQDYSLAEIAQELDTSPQAIVDFLNRATSSLKRYESHLELVRKFQERNSIIENIQAGLDKLEQSTSSNDSTIEAIQKIKTNADKLMNI